MQSVDKKSYVYIVAFLHIILVGIGIADLVEEQQILYEEYSIVIIVIYYSIHFLLLFSLVFAVYKNNPLLMLPWLVSTCLVLVTASAKSVLATGNLSKGVSFYLWNFLIIGAYWFAWYVVLSHFRDIIKKRSEEFHKLSVTSPYS